MVIVIPHEWIQLVYPITILTILYALSGFLFWVGWDYGKYRDTESIFFAIAGIVLFLIPTITIMFAAGVIVIE